MTTGLPTTTGEDRNVALTGLPRSGTTLVCHLLNKLPDVVALNEPMRVDKLATLPDRDAMCESISDFFRESRASISNSGTAYSRHVDGSVPDNVVGQNRVAGQRKDDAVRGLIRIDKPLPADYLLCIKHPVAFTALLPELARCFPTFAMVRNPLSVLASWNSVDMPFTRGRAPAAENLDPRLRAILDVTNDAMERQLQLLDWFFDQYRSGLAPGRIIRYEDIITSGGSVLSCIAPGAADLHEPLVEKNTNKLYKPETVQELAERLLAIDGAYLDFYQRDDVRRVRDTVLS